jgi:hypothetical protein
MKYRDYKVEVLKYLISYFRQNEDIKNILLAIGLRFNELQDVIVQMLDSLTISKARGFLLDNIGTEVGTTRDETDYGDYFCVNVPHLNVEKRFYFLASNLDPNQKVTLKDAEFIQKIMAVIGSNLSSGTRNENLNIIKMITNAESVIIKKVGTCELEVHLMGSNLTYTRNTLKYIQDILIDGVFLKEVYINE